MSLYLSRLTIARTPTTAALRALIDPSPASEDSSFRDPAQGRMMDAHHRLLWAVFADSPDRTRDFLWRAEGQGRFYVLSARPPVADGAGLFEPPEIKTFDPDLRPDDRLAFVLRANATRARIDPAAPEKRGRRVDVVMDLLYGLPSGRVSDERRLARDAAADMAGRRWLEDRAGTAGFAVEQLAVTSYTVVPLPRHVGGRRQQPQFGVLDMMGEIRVVDPEVFMARIAEGFGRARAFGCGLMLIRRA